MKTDKENLEDLFEVAFNFMLASSGDGGSLIVCEKYLDIADCFHQWLDIRYPDHNYERNDCPYKNTTTFFDRQEGIIFIDKFKREHDNMYEFIAILPRYYNEFI